MRKTLYALPVAVAAAAAFVTPASAQPYPYYAAYPWPAPWVAGAAVGTAVGIGAYNGWFGGALAGAGAGSAVAGGVAGIGAVALVDGILQPCRGFQALFGLNHGACVDGVYVGYRPRPAGARVMR